MAPKLYSCRLSPCARAVELCARAIELELEVISFNLLDGDYLKSDLPKINPKHTVPTLDDDGFYLWDSHAIMVYLMGKYGKGSPLYPDEVQSRALVNQRLFFDCGELFARHIAVIGPLLFGAVSEISEEAIQSVAANYAIVEHYLQGGKFVAGNQVTIADFSIWCTITNAITYCPLDEEKYPKIKPWIRRMELLPYATLNIEGGKAFGKLVDSLRNK